jgi:hypothetical protein
MPRVVESTEEEIGWISKFRSHKSFASRLLRFLVTAAVVAAGRIGFPGAFAEAHQEDHKCE